MDEKLIEVVAEAIAAHSEYMIYDYQTGVCECGGQYTPTGRVPKNGPKPVDWTPEHQAEEVLKALRAAWPTQYGVGKFNDAADFEVDADVRPRYPARNGWKQYERIAPGPWGQVENPYA